MLIEAYKDAEAGSAHVNSEHFRTFTAEAAQALVETPQIISEQISAGGWNRMGEITVG